MTLEDVTVWIRDDAVVAANGACSPAATKQQQQHAPASSPSSKRLFYLDWLRALVIALVVAFHCIDLEFDYTKCAAYYLGIVNVAPDDMTRMIALVMAQLMQSFFMGLMFFISGFFSAPSYNSKGPGRFLADRTLRLMLPLAVYEFLLQPLAFEIARHSAAAPAALAASGNGFVYYFTTQYSRFGHGAGWFLVWLYIFDLVYCCARVAVGCFGSCRGSRSAAAVAPDTTGQASSTVITAAPKAADHDACEQQQQRHEATTAPRDYYYYSPLRLLAITLSLGCTISALTLIVRLSLHPRLPVFMWWIQGLQFQPAYLAQYAAAFATGLLARRADALARLPARFGYACSGAALLMAAAGGALMLHMPGSNFGDDGQPGTAGYVAAFAIWEQFYAVLMSMALLVVGRQHCNLQGGRVGAAVAGAAYAVYILHVPVVTAFGCAFKLVSWHPALECLVITPMVIVVCWVVGMLLRLIPGVKRVL